MLWTIFTFLMMALTLGLLFHVGGIFVPLVLALALVVLLLKLAVHWTSFN